MLISVPVFAVDISIIALSGFRVDQNLLVKHNTAIGLLKLFGNGTEKEGEKFDPGV
jgi:hypothetical protein